MPPCSRRRGARPPLSLISGSLSWRARCVMLGSSRSLRVAVGAVAGVRRSWRHCLRRRAGASSFGLFVPPCSRRRDARPPLYRGGGLLSRRRRSVVLGCLRSLHWLWRRSPSRSAHGAAGCGAALALLALACSCRHSWRRDALTPLLRCGGSPSRRVWCVILCISRSLRVTLGAVAVARCSRRRFLRRRAGAPSAGLFMPPCSRRRDARPPLFRGGGSLSRRARCVILCISRSLRVTLKAVAVARRLRRRCLRCRAGAPSAG